MSGIERAEDGHQVLDGARWHYPKLGEPTVCAVEGCDRVLGVWRNADPLDGLEADDDTDSGNTDSADSTDDVQVDASVDPVSSTSTSE